MLALLILFSQPESACASVGALARFEFSRIVMGVSARIVFYADDASQAHDAANAVYDRLNRLDAVMSDYRPDSELMVLCRAQAGKPHEVSDDLASILARSREIAEATEGAFDPTVGPIVKLWRIARKTGTRPDDADLAAARAAVGYEKLTVDERAGTVTLRVPHMQLDLGGIGKGWAADEAIKVLTGRGIDRALIDFGGDLTASGPPPGRQAWVIAIETGIRSGEAAGRKNTEVQIVHGAVATSGDVEQHVVIDGVRYGHLIDPRTGEPVTRATAATVTATTGLLADALASAACVLGKQGTTLERLYKGVSVTVEHASGEGCPSSCPGPGHAAGLVTGHDWV